MEIIKFFVDDGVGIFAVASTWICTVIINFILASINFFCYQFATHDPKGVVLQFDIIIFQIQNGVAGDSTQLTTVLIVNVTAD